MLTQEDQEQKLTRTTRNIFRKTQSPKITEISLKETESNTRSNQKKKSIDFKELNAKIIWIRNNKKTEWTME